MASGIEFAGLMASLRSARVAVLISKPEWSFLARRALEFFGRTWGGASDVIVPVDADGNMHPGIERLLLRYDPDYVTNLQLSLKDVEALDPGNYPLKTLQGADVPPDERAAFIDDLELHGPQIVRMGLQDEVVESIAARVRSFMESGSCRVSGIHPDSPAPRPLVSVELQHEAQISVETGNPLIDLALGMRRGFAAKPIEERLLRDGSLTRNDVVSLLTNDSSVSLVEPFDATRVGLTSIAHGYFRRETPLVVLGQEADDFALAMLWDRLVGLAIWLPVTHQEADWHAPLGVGLDSVRRSPRTKLHISSISLSEAECDVLMRAMWQARWLRDPSEDSEPWEYVAPEELDPTGRVVLRLQDKWDERFAAPMNIRGDGAAEMATTFPLIAPDQLPSNLEGWIVEANWPERPILSHTAMTGRDLLAADQSPFETFVRPSGSGIAFESGRYDLVLAGASRFGQLAQPKLRWPSLLSMLQTTASASGFQVRASHAGKVGRVAADLWQGRELLAEDLTGLRRPLLGAFQADTDKNGPVDSGEAFKNDERRLMVQGSCLVPFKALVRESGLSETEVRDWLDMRTAAGAVRMGLVLECTYCPWHDFYSTDDFGAHFRCKRCGEVNRVTSREWRQPVSGPLWYFQLHPTVTQFLACNGDVPVLAVRQFSRHRRVAAAEFELELVKAGQTRATTEFDFAFTTQDGLVLGEAKSSGDLDGRKEADRVRDVEKLLRAATSLGAREICYASAVKWTQGTYTAIQRAIEGTGTLVTVSLLEELRGAAPTSRKVIHNPAGP